MARARTAGGQHGGQHQGDGDATSDLAAGGRRDTGIKLGASRADGASGGRRLTWRGMSAQPGGDRLALVDGDDGIDEEQLRAADGRVPGRRGRATRQTPARPDRRDAPGQQLPRPQGGGHRPRGGHLAGHLLPVLPRGRVGHPRAGRGDGATRARCCRPSCATGSGRAAPPTPPPSRWSTASSTSGRAIDR